MRGFWVQAYQADIAQIGYKKVEGRLKVRLPTTTARKSIRNLVGVVLLQRQKQRSSFLCLG